MNRSKLKTYAPQARRDFIQAVTDRATHFGLTAKKIEPMTEQGEVVLIGGRPFPKSVGAKRKKLESRIQKLGFEQTMEAMAYTWFNRLVAIRFMELHGYLEHGFRVLSHPEGHPQPEILEHAQHVDLHGLDQKKVVELKLDGTKEEDLYRLLLIAQCNALHKALPFLFESIDNETELLLPDRLLHSDSLIRNLVNEIPEEDWQEVEIIGWLYQFYISDRKDEVIGKVVASEDIPAATQLFTPNWIVKYLVQNTLGRQWMATYPNSPLKGQMKFYIEPAEQTPEVQEQLKAITPTSLTPEELTLLDPACGSGHILVEAYDLFKLIYQERGYRTKDIPAFILQRNLFGLEIDDRATQLAAFALMMKARTDDRRIFESEAKPNILSYEDSQGMNATDITHALNSPILNEPMPAKEMLFEEIEEERAGLFSKKTLAEKGHVSQADIASLLALFENAKTFGSLIQVPPNLAAKLSGIEQRLNDVLKHGDLTHAPARVLRPLLLQARLLARQYDVVVANPPYMGSKYLNPIVTSYLKTHFSGFEKDLFSAATLRFSDFTKRNGFEGYVTPFSWMFLSSFEEMRKWVIDDVSLLTLVQLEINAFEPAMVTVCVFSIQRTSLNGYTGSFVRLSDFRGAESQPIKTLEAVLNKSCGWFYEAQPVEFKKLPGCPIAYWVSAIERNMYISGVYISQHCQPRKGMDTGENAEFLRLWHEVSICRTSILADNGTPKWFPYNKGGDYRKWYGNRDYLVNWGDNGAAIKARLRWTKKKPTLRNQQHYFQEGYTWTTVSSSSLSARYTPKGALFDNGGCTLFSEEDIHYWGGLLNSKVSARYLEFLSPTLNFQPGDIGRILYLPPTDKATVIANTQALVRLAKQDWDSLEQSWEFQASPLLLCSEECLSIEAALQSWKTTCDIRFGETKRLEEDNNRIFIGTYGLGSQMTAEVLDGQITLYRPERVEDVKRLISYAIGCMMGRYSLDKPGLINALGENQGFDSNCYKSFRADDDGIIPLLDTDWGIVDDAINRIVEFISVAWPNEGLEENLAFIANSLSPTNDERPRETIRRYLTTGFYKDHLSQKFYSKRPIYWLFSSGKQRAFQCLIYLHRYHEGTLARMRNEYVIPLMGKMTARIEKLEGRQTSDGQGVEKEGGDIDSATSSPLKRKLEKQRDTIKRQLAEIQAFDEKLRHNADQRIKLDLDDGVKVNYGKFGDLLAEVKTVTGGAADE